MPVVAEKPIGNAAMTHRSGHKAQSPSCEEEEQGSGSVGTNRSMIIPPFFPSHDGCADASPVAPPSRKQLPFFAAQPFVPPNAAAEGRGSSETDERVQLPSITVNVLTEVSPNLAAAPSRMPAAKEEGPHGGQGRTSSSAAIPSAVAPSVPPMIPKLSFSRLRKNDKNNPNVNGSVEGGKADGMIAPPDIAETSPPPPPSSILPPTATLKKETKPLSFKLNTLVPSSVSKAMLAPSDPAVSTVTTVKEKVKGPSNATLGGHPSSSSPHSTPQRKGAAKAHPSTTKTAATTTVQPVADSSHTTNVTSHQHDHLLHCHRHSSLSSSLAASEASLRRVSRQLQQMAKAQIARDAQQLHYELNGPANSLATHEAESGMYRIPTASLPNGVDTSAPPLPLPSSSHYFSAPVAVMRIEALRRRYEALRQQEDAEAEEAARTKNETREKGMGKTSSVSKGGDGNVFIAFLHYILFYNPLCVAVRQPFSCFILQPLKALKGYALLMTTMERAAAPPRALIAPAITWMKAHFPPFSTKSSHFFAALFSFCHGILDGVLIMVGVYALVVSGLGVYAYCAHMYTLYHHDAASAANVSTAHSPLRIAARVSSLKDDDATSSFDFNDGSSSSSSDSVSGFRLLWASFEDSLLTIVMVGILLRYYLAPSPLHR